MIDRHEILRTQFLIVDGEPVQKILDHVEADIECIKSDRADEELIAENMRPFDLEKPPMLRMTVVDKGDHDLFMLDMHHIIGDGMSAATFFKEFIAIYNGEHLEPLAYQFKDYSEWMRNRDLGGQAEYWKNQFNDEIPVLDMPTDFSRPQEQSNKGTIILSLLIKTYTVLLELQHQEQAQLNTWFILPQL